MSFLITGGCGCIGSYVIRDLLGRGERVINYDADPGVQILNQVVPRDAMAGLVQVRGDITDQFHLARVIREENVRKVIHLASLQIPASDANPPLAERVVVGGLVNVLEIARLVDLDAVVWASSIAVFGLGVSMHSGGELGVSLAAMLHTAASLSNLAFAADAHYHHVMDDVIKGGKFRYVGGEIAVPKGPGLGVELDPDKMARYAEEYRLQGQYDYHQDPGRPGWVMSIPGFRYAEVGKNKIRH